MSITMVLAATLAASPAPADQQSIAIGRWKTETRGGIVEIQRCGTSICGRIVSSEALRTNPALADSRNTNAALRNRPLRGLQILSGFTAGPDGSWVDGTIYNAEDGKTYNARVTPAGANQLKLRGCVFVPFCKTQTWTRVN
ncbi:MAG: DUF2147 domain-containing protein [Sphingomonas sp.]